MKRMAILVTLAMGMVPTLLAQAYDHGEVGIYADYLRLSQLGDLNSIGLGGRAGFNVHPHVALEAEMSWDFNRGFTQTCSGCLPVGTVRSGIKVLHGLFGPKFQAGSSGPIRAFVEVKGGFFNPRFANVAGTFGNFTSQVSGVTSSDTYGALFPGGGLEFFAGPFGLRFDVGDLIYFQNGAHNNLRITGGPAIRF